MNSPPRLTNDQTDVNNGSSKLMTFDDMLGNEYSDTYGA